MLTREAVDNYLESCLSLSQQTIAWYRKILGHFVAYCPTLPTKPEPIERFLASYKKKCNDETLRAYYRVLKTLYIFREHRYRESNPMRFIRTPCCKRKAIQTLDTPEQAMILSIGKNDRDCAILTLFLDSMIRCGESASLRREDISGNTIKVCGKTGERIVPISESTAHLLSHIGQGEYLFIGRRGPLTAEGISKIVKKYLKSLGIKKKLGPHLLRHTAATQFIENGGNPFVLQQILGHATLKATSEYVRLAATKMAAKQQFSAIQNGRHRCPKCGQLVFREKYEEGDNLVCICGWSGYLNGGQQHEQSNNVH